MSDDRLRRAYAEELKQGYLKTGFKQGFEAGYAKAKKDFERPRGEWKEVYLTPEEKCFYGELWECSVCWVRDKKSNFCPNCGADMLKEGE